MLSSMGFNVFFTSMSLMMFGLGVVSVLFSSMG